MFWRFGGYANISSIDSILDKPDCTLEDILDENDAEQELKSQNAKLIDFLRDESNLVKLLKYVVAPKPIRPPRDSQDKSPPEEEKPRSGGFFKSRSKVRSKSRGATDDDFEAREEKWRRYSFVSTQLLSSDVWSIAESLLENTDALREFWNYIKLDPELDNMQAGNFTKVNDSLLDKKPTEMATFLKLIDGIVDSMIKHVNCPVVMDLLLKIISLEKESAPGVVDWLQTEDLIPKLLSFVSPDHSQTVQTAAGDFLKAIITISANATGQDTSVIGPNELTRQLVSRTCIDQLMTEMLKGGNPLTVGVGIVIEVIRKNNSDYDHDTQVGPEPKSSDPIYLGTLLRIFSDHIHDFMNLILSPQHTVMTEEGSTKITRKDLSTAWGARIEPLGFDRFKTCELMAELLHCSNMALLNDAGAEAEVHQRDQERERLKAEGRLAAEPPPEDKDEFAASVDSHGFHHAEAFSPLGESPEKVRSPDAQGNGLDEEFEKVNLSEADPEVPLETAKTTSEKQSPSKPSPTKRRSSLLTEQLQREKAKTTSPTAEKPAPLFASRSDNAASDASKDLKDTGPSAQGLDDETKETSDGQTAAQPNDSVPQEDNDPTALVGDLLKSKFVEHRVVPTVIDFFFRFPWNNFLHNVVYDVVQQVFNGPMDRGYNRYLAIDLFETGRVTERVIEGQKRSDEAQEKQKMRLGYMGHLTLIAEEVVKFTERQPPKGLAQLVVDKIESPDWTRFVETTLTETRERDNAILGGVRPDTALGPRQAVLNAVNAAQNAGYSGNSITNSGNTGLDSLDLTNAGAAGYGLNSNSSTLLSGFNNSDDEEDEDIDEGEIGGVDGAEGSRRPHHLDDDDQNALEDGDSSDKPAPLSLPPIDRAKKTFLKSRRKAGKASLNTAPTFNEALSSDSDFVTTPTSSSGAADFPDVEGAADQPGGQGFEDDFTGFGSDEPDDAEGSDEDTSSTQDKDTPSDDEEDEDEEDDDEVKPLQRQATTEAVERRPLDEGSNSSDEEDSDSSDRSTPTSSSTAPPAKSPTTLATPLSPTRSAAANEAKRREQARVRAGWDFDEEEDNDDDDSDDEPVQMGGKYMARRRTGS